MESRTTFGFQTTRAKYTRTVTSIISLNNCFRLTSAHTVIITSVQAGAVLMPLAMFLLSLKSIRVLSIMNFILKLAYLYKVTEKKRLIYMHLL